jgi:hypothetical protein
MANIAFINYAITGPSHILDTIKAACSNSYNSVSTESNTSQTCKILGINKDTVNKSSLRENFTDEPEIIGNTLYISSEAAWNISDFKDLLKRKFPEITIYWKEEECGNEVYCKNDGGGMFFPENYLIEACVDGNETHSEYFEYLDDGISWLHDLTDGLVTSKEDVDWYNKNYCNNDGFISIHEFDIMDG